MSQVLRNKPPQFPSHSGLAALSDLRQLPAARAAAQRIACFTLKQTALCGENWRPAQRRRGRETKKEEARNGVNAYTLVHSHTGKKDWKKHAQFSMLPAHQASHRPTRYGEMNSKAHKGCTKQLIVQHTWLWLFIKYCCIQKPLTLAEPATLL